MSNTNNPRGPYLFLFHELDNFKKTLKFKLITVKQPFEAINPNYKFKRGLINGFGTFHKSIKGTKSAFTGNQENMASI